MKNLVFGFCLNPGLNGECQGQWLALFLRTPHNEVKQSSKQLWTENKENTKIKIYMICSHLKGKPGYICDTKSKILHLI